VKTLLRWATWTTLLCLPNVVYAASNISLTITSAAGGFPIAGGMMAMGNVNGLGIGSTSTESSGIAGGILYVSPYNLDVTLSGADKNNNVNISAVVTANFTHVALLNVRNCQPGPCNTGASFTAIPTSGSIAVIPTTFVKTSQTFTPTIAVFVSSGNGASAFAGSDQVTITFTASVPGDSTTATLTISLNLQTVVQLTLGTAQGGLSVTPALDYATNFGNVNGLGIGTPTAGLTKTSIAGGYIYSTPYLITPTFADFTSTTGNVTVYVSTDFTHPSTLNLRDAATCCASFAPISKVAGAPTTITAAAASTTAITRYLGLFVSSANGGGAFSGTAAASGSDSAKLTFTLTVP